MEEPIRGVIFDIDGVLVFQGHVLPGAVETIEALRARGMVLRFLTNSTRKSRRSCAEGLRRHGFSIFAHEVITASSATATYLASLRPRSCWVMLEGEGMDEFQGLPLDAHDPQFLVIGDNRSAFDFAHLNDALRLLLGGASLIGMQEELLDRSEGPPELNVGSWVGMLERAAGVRATYLGKPSRYAFKLTLQSGGLRPREVLMVGDKVSTDIVGAQRAGIRSVLVKTGEFDPRELRLARPPDFTVDSVREVIPIVDRLAAPREGLGAAPQSTADSARGTR